MSLAEDPYHRFRLRIQELLDRVDERDRTIERRDRTIQKLYSRNYWFKHGRDLWRHRAKHQSRDSRYLRQNSRSIKPDPEEDPLHEVTQPDTASTDTEAEPDDDGDSQDDDDGA